MTTVEPLYALIETLFPNMTSTTYTLPETKELELYP